MTRQPTSAARTACLGLAAAALVLGLPAAAQAAVQLESQAQEDFIAFADKLETCEAGVFEMPHPLMTGFTIRHEIEGMKDGACAYTQSMPGGMTMICAFSEAGRAAMAEEMRQTARTGRMSGSTGNAPGWTEECEVETPDAARLPMGGSTPPE